MLATLLIFRQILQNIKEVLQPYLYEHHKLGALRTLWDLIQTMLLNYSHLIVQRIRLTCQTSLDVNKSVSPPEQSEKRERRSLIASYRVPKTEEGYDDAGLKQRKVSFTEKVEYKDNVVEAPTQASLQDDDSPTLVEEGMDSSLIFDIRDDDDDDDSDMDDSVSKPQSTQRRKPRSAGENNSTEKKMSWMDPPEETESTVLTQPEIECCMLTYEVCASPSRSSVWPADEIDKTSLEMRFLWLICYFLNPMPGLQIVSKTRPFSLISTCRILFRITRRCSYSLAMLCSSPLHFLWQPCVPS